MNIFNELLEGIKNRFLTGLTTVIVIEAGFWVLMGLFWLYVIWRARVPKEK